jgi:multiple antibiotic resistance protein
MALAALFLKTFFGFFAVMDPIGAIPIFIAMTVTNSEPERRSMVMRASLTALGVLLFFAVSQMWIFNFFGFTMGAFRVAGGLLLFLIAFSMLSAHEAGARQSEEEKSEGVEKDDISITPLAVPLLAGPATIASVVLAFGQARSVSQHSTVILSLLAVCVASWLILRGASRLSTLLGTSGIKIVTRMMGLILAAMAIQFVAEGLWDLFPVLAGTHRGGA